MNINRNLYLDRLISKKNNGLLKVITGIRRSGKSYLLFSIFGQYLRKTGVDEQHIIEISFDRFEDKKYQDPELAYSYIQNRLRDAESYYILLDEIQLLKESDSILNSLLRIQNVDLYVTGSDSDFLSNMIAGNTDGQIDEVRVYPLNFSEFMSIFEGNQYDGWNEYILSGGLPPVIQIPDREQKNAFLKRLFGDVILNNTSSRRRIRNQSELGELLNILSASIGSMTNPKQLSDYFETTRNIRISQTTLKNYLDFLQGICLISTAKRYDIKGKRYISTPLKYYFADIGIRNACIDFRQIGENRVMENVIFNELLIRQFQVDAGVASFSLRNETGQVVRKQLEVDFICSKGTRRYYIQSAFSIPDDTRMQQVQEPFHRIDDFFKRIVITKDCPAPYYTENGVLVLSIYDFLLKPDAMNF